LIIQSIFAIVSLPERGGVRLAKVVMRKNGAQCFNAASMAGAALLAAAFGPAVPAQTSAAGPGASWTTADDHRNMLEQLGIRTLRPGRNADASKPNAANYDETLANPYPLLPDPLVTKSGAKVTTAEAWWSERRPEIVEAFEREVVGRVPADVPAVSWSVVATREWKIAGKRVVGRQLVGTVDNSAYPGLGVEICMTLVTPAKAEGVPVMIMFGGGALPPEAIDGEDLPAVCRPPGRPGPPPGRPGAPRAGAAPPAGDPPATDQLIAAGWGFASLRPTSVQADNGAGLRSGIIGLVNKGQPRKPDDWGALRAWAWGASRGLDWLETQSSVDAKRVGIEGVSRYGKAALVAMAFDERFAVVLVGSSGEGGAKLHRRNFGEAVENLTAAGEYHWMAGNFLKYGAADAAFGSMTPGDLPVDAHELIALCAPRPVFVSYGVPEKGDALWLDHQGSFMAAVAAQPVFRLLGAKDLGRSDDYGSEKMPPVNVGVLDGALAWRQHDGGHTDGPNWRYFIPWANEQLGL
jgi:(4-O-methyl)-D-glucuronate---lignin esterase